MKYVLLLVLITLPGVMAAQIQSVYYDAINEAGSEYIIILNNDDGTLSLDGWTISTPTSATDATLSGNLTAGAQYIIADAGWADSKDDASWPSADHEETLTLPNTAGYVELVDATGTTIDTVGWGDSVVAEGTPHPGVAEGEALVRVNDTGDNSVDFIATTPTFSTGVEPSTTTYTTTVNVTVNNTPPRIDAITIDDDSPEPGVQLIPVPGSTRTVNALINVTDHNGIDTLTVTINGYTLSTNDSGATGTYTGTFDIVSTDTTIKITVSDEETTTTETLPVTMLSVAAISIPETIDFNTDPGTSSEQRLIIENTGTTNIDIQLKGTTPTHAGKLLGDVTYWFSGQEYALTETFREHDIGLGPRESTSIDLRFAAGYVPAGHYTGQILIAAVAQ